MSEHAEETIERLSAEERKRVNEAGYMVWTNRVYKRFPPRHCGPEYCSELLVRGHMKGAKASEQSQPLTLYLPNDPERGVHAGDGW